MLEPNKYCLKALHSRYSIEYRFKIQPIWYKEEINFLSGFSNLPIKVQLITLSLSSQLNSSRLYHSTMLLCVFQELSELIKSNWYLLVINCENCRKNCRELSRNCKNYGKIGEYRKLDQFSLSLVAWTAIQHCWKSNL